MRPFYKIFVIPFALLLFVNCKQREIRSFCTDEYQIYSTIVDSLYKKDCGIPDREEKIKTIFISDSTTNKFKKSIYSISDDDGKSYYPVYGYESLIQKMNLSTSDSTELIDDFFNVNTDYQHLNVDSLKTSLKIVPINYSRYSIKKLDAFYDSLELLHNDACGFMVFSRVGFNLNRDIAITYFGLHCGSLCGNTAYVFFRKINSKWNLNGYLLHYEI